MAEIPEFGEDAQAAAFWDRHSLADFSDQVEPAEVTFARATKQVVSVRLDPEDLKLLKAMAADQGVGHSTLARMWVREHLQEARRPSRAQKTPPARGQGA